jgi:hypothetical protein
MMIAVPWGVEVWPHIITRWLRVSDQSHSSSPGILAQEEESLVYAGCEAGLNAVEKRNICASAWELNSDSPVFWPAL